MKARVERVKCELENTKELLDMIPTDDHLKEKIFKELAALLETGIRSLIELTNLLEELEKCNTDDEIEVLLKNLA